MTQKIKKLLVANRGEIAIRIFRACTEMGISTVSIYSKQDRLSLFRYKADEAYLVGKGKGAVEAYLDQEAIIKLALKYGVDAIHPGYGFLSENADFAEKVKAAGIVWVGPTHEVMRALGDKIQARALANKVGVPVVPGSDGALKDMDDAKKVVADIGFPLILKAAGGGGGRGMAVVRREEDFQMEWERCQQESLKAFGNPEIFVERFVDHPQHIEVQILGDSTGHAVHLFERDCSVQRRFQKVVETAPSRNLTDELREKLFAASIELSKDVGYSNAGTFEFLVETQDPHKGKFYFIEANTRLQVEHTVTEWITGVDLVQAQIDIASGKTLADLHLDKQENIKCHGFSIQCRINAEDPETEFSPQTGRISTWRSAAGMGVRLDSGGGDVNFEIGSDYDSLLCKLSTWALTFDAAAKKMSRALSEFRIRGVRTNIPFLKNVVVHPEFCSGFITTCFIDENSELFKFAPRLNRANKILNYIGHTTLHRETEPKQHYAAHLPVVTKMKEKGTKQLYTELGKEAFFKKIREDKKLWVTDTALRDGHQSLFATRLRSKDMYPILPLLNEMPFWSLEVWGGATYDVAYRFLKECPWQRLERIRELAPDVLLQMLLRGSNVLGYKNQPDNLIRTFVKEAHAKGVDVFRIFDALNYVPNLKVSTDTVKEVGGIAELSLCYTGDVADPKRTNYPLSYYVDLAGELSDLGADIIAIKDMAGLLTPRAAEILIPAIREVISCPLHLHTHDTSSFGGATLLKASEMGVDVVDAAMGPMSGLTSQPNLGTLVANLVGDERATGLDSAQLREIEYYWRAVREHYSEFESGLKSGSASVYWHEIPGGQYSNLVPQAKAMGLEDRWPEVLQRFKEASELMGDPIKVTPTSKAVGDLAIAMMNKGVGPEEVKANPKDFDWPSSVKDYFKGMMGQHPNGFDKVMQKAVLGDEEIFTDRAGNHLADIDFEVMGQELNELLGRPAKTTEILSHVLFPGPFKDYVRHIQKYGDTSVMDTEMFFHGVELGEEVEVELEEGKTLIIKLVAIGEPNDRGERRFHFELNGFPRSISIKDLSLQGEGMGRKQADIDRKNEIGAPMPGKISKMYVAEGNDVEIDQPLFAIEAMKMETIVKSKVKGKVKSIVLNEGEVVEKEDLIVTLDLI